MKLSNLIKKTLLAAALTLASASFAGAESRSDWKAHWITHPWVQSTTNTWISYRKEVNVTKRPDKLIARIAVDSKYWMWINGELAVFEGGLKRGPFPNGTYYDKVDIAPSSRRATTRSPSCSGTSGSRGSATTAAVRRR